MKFNKLSILSLVLIVVVAAIGFILSPMLPVQMASHWNKAGEVNGYLPKIWGIVLLPLISFIFLIVFWLIPFIDPLRRNISTFRKYYDQFSFGLVLFLLYLHTLSLVYNLGWTINITRFLIPAVAIFIYYLGILLKHAKRNWFIGMRTPWTLSSDAVWDKTNELGSVLFKISAAIVLLGIVADKLVLWFILIPILGSAIIAAIYSYVYYLQLNK